MKTYSASIVGLGAEFDELTVSLEEKTDPSGLRSWYGFFQVEPVQLAEVGGPYRLRLADGRSGDILIKKITTSSDSPMQISFVGTGPLGSECQ